MEVYLYGGYNVEGNFILPKFKVKDTIKLILNGYNLELKLEWRTAHNNNYY